MILPLGILIALILITLFYFWLVKPRVRRPAAAADASVMLGQKLFAHRGLFDNTSDAPENSLRAFQKAIDHHFGIELDVHLTRDGIPVVVHDFKLARVCGEEVKGCVEDYTLAQLQQFRLFGSDQTIPTFQTVLDLIHGQVPLIVELKTESFDIRVCPGAQALLDQYKGWYCVESFNPWAIFWYRRHYPKIIRGQLSDNFFQYPEYRKFPVCLGAFVLQFLLLNVLSRPDFIAYNCKFPGNTSRRLCRTWGAIAAAWTVKSQAEFEEVQKDFDVFIFDSFVPDSPEG